MVPARVKEHQRERESKKELEREGKAPSVILNEYINNHF